MTKLPFHFLLQFLGWGGMFLLWLDAWPLITGEILHLEQGGGGATLTGVRVLSLSFLGYAGLAQVMGLCVAYGERWLGAWRLYALLSFLGACGFYGLSYAESAWALVPCFMGIACGWCALNMAYALVAPCFPPERLALGYRLFGFAALIPQTLVVVCLWSFTGTIDGAMARSLMRLAAGAWGLAALLAALWSFLVQV